MEGGREGGEVSTKRGGPIEHEHGHISARTQGSLHVTRGP